MSGRNKGVGLIALILTAAVMIITAGAVIILGRDYISKARKASLDSDISAMRQEVEIYYNLNSSLPAKTLEDGVTPVIVSKKYLPQLLQDGLASTEDSSAQSFYIVDLDKLQAVTTGKGMSAVPNLNGNLITWGIPVASCLLSDLYGGVLLSCEHNGFLGQGFYVRRDINAFKIFM